KRLQRQTALQVPLFPRNFRAVQTAGDADFDSLAAKTQSRINRFAHGAAERNALFKLQRDGFSDEGGVELRAVHFLNVNVHFALGALRNLLLELVDFRALAADNDAGTRGVDADDELVRGALDVNRANAGGLELVLELFAELDVLMQQIGIVAIGV